MNFATDDNNNTSGEKSYSLRPRAVTKRDSEETENEEVTWKPRNRSRKRQKQKSVPLSKYRRKTANARERSRMREINDAFEVLRKSIPHLASNFDNNNEKISKIMTLRLAMKYITALSNALEEPESYSLDLQSLMIDNSSTSSSISDHLSWQEQPFILSPSSEPTTSVLSPLTCTVVSSDSMAHVNSIAPNVPRTLTTGQPESLPQCNFSHFFVSETSESIPRTSFGNSRTDCAKRNPHHIHSSRPLELSRHTLTPPDDATLQLPFVDLHSNATSSANDFQSNLFFNADFDGLPSPVMDFCDLFVT